MKNNYYAIYDTVSELYMTPILFQNDKMALRWFSDVINNKQANETIYNNAADFELFKLGIYDNATGIIDSEMHKLANGLTLKKED